MELNWEETYLIIALRVLKPFFRKHGFGLYEVEFGFRDGDYLVFKSLDKEIMIIYNPGFDIIISKKNLFRTKEYSIVKLKNDYPLYSNLPDKYHGEDGLKEIIEGYCSFLEDIISNKKL